MSLFLPFVLNILLFVFVSIDASGDFWFVSDFHVDQNYSRTGNPADMCHDDVNVHPDAGLYGNFLCDSPYSLVEASIEAMGKIQPNPDFIIWTGDNLPHTEPAADYDVVFPAIKNISNLLSSTFPNIPVYACIGNHDTFPPNILFLNATADGIYEEYLEKGGWKKFLSAEARSTFLQGGYYSEVIKPGLRIISLNTILWYTPNIYTKDLEDPVNQFKWLNQILKNSTLLSEKVYIMGHVPPGFYNRGVPGKKSDSTFHIHFLDKYLDILHRYSETIIGQLYGHIHMDMFQLFQFNTGVFKSSSILASSVTPWYVVSEYNSLLPVNPSVRLMHYSAFDFSLKDYDQYYMNLTKVNSLKGKDLEQDNLFELLYRFTDFYNVPDLSTESLLRVYEMLKKNETVFKDFFKFLTAGKEIVTCEEDCKVAQLCAMSGISVDEYDLCMKTVNETDISKDIPYNINTNVVITVIITLTIMILIAIFILYQKCWKSNWWKSRHETEYERFMNFQ